jgi:hypothetical protein
MTNYFNLNDTSPTHKLLKAKMFKTYRITSLKKHLLTTSYNLLLSRLGDHGYEKTDVNV